VLLLSSSFLVGMLIPTRSNRLVEAESLAFSAVFVGGIYAVAGQLMAVTDYPSRSPGQKATAIYEYSIYFGAGRYIYPGELTAIRQASGRYLLWGLPFLIPEAPIWYTGYGTPSCRPRAPGAGVLVAWRSFPRTKDTEGQSIQAAKNAARTNDKEGRSIPNTDAAEGRSIQRTNASPYKVDICFVGVPVPGPGAGLHAAHSERHLDRAVRAAGGRWKWLAATLAAGIAG